MALSRVVVDASAVLTLLVEPGDRNDRVASRLAGLSWCAPALLPFEVANVLRRQASTGILAAGQAELALDGFGMLPIELWPWDAVAARVWQLRGSMTAYDAAYVALAELLACPLVTGDARLARAPGARCVVDVV